MAILDKELLPKQGPYIEFVRTKSQLVYEGGWPAKNLYQQGIVYQMADAFLDCLCDATNGAVFFDPWEVTQISAPSRLAEFSVMLLTWSVDIARKSDIKIVKAFKRLNYYRRDDISASEIRADVVETLTYLARQPLEAAVKNEFFVVIGI